MDPNFKPSDILMNDTHGAEVIDLATHLSDEERGPAALPVAALLSALGLQ